MGDRDLGEMMRSVPEARAGLVEAGPAMHSMLVDASKKIQTAFADQAPAIRRELEKALASFSGRPSPAGPAA